MGWAVLGARPAVDHRSVAGRASADRRAPTAMVWLTYNGEIYNFAEIRARAGGARLRVPQPQRQRGHRQWLARLGPSGCSPAARHVRAGDVGPAHPPPDPGARPARQEAALLRPGGSGRTALSVRLRDQGGARLAGDAARRRTSRDRQLSDACNTCRRPRPLSSASRKLPPAHYLVVEADAGGRLARGRAGALLGVAGAAQRAGRRRRRRSCSGELLAHLEEAVRLRMIADVPLGAFLSGGVDSSAVVAMMARAGAGPGQDLLDRLLRPRNTTRPAMPAWSPSATAPSTRSSSSSPMRSRYCRSWSGITASRSPTRRRSRPITSSQMARRHVTVALNGDGGDEAFLGYPRYQAMRHLARLDRLPRCGAARRWRGCAAAGAGRRRNGGCGSAQIRDVLRAARRAAGAALCRDDRLLRRSRQGGRLWRGDAADRAGALGARPAGALFRRRGEPRHRRQPGRHPHLSARRPDGEGRCRQHGARARNPLAAARPRAAGMGGAPAEPRSRWRAARPRRCSSRRWRRICRARSCTARRWGSAARSTSWLRRELKELAYDTLLSPAARERGLFRPDYRAPPARRALRLSRQPPHPALGTVDAGAVVPHLDRRRGRRSRGAGPTRGVKTRGGVNDTAPLFVSGSAAKIGVRPKLLFLVTEDWYFCSHRLPVARAAREAGFEVVVATRVRAHGERDPRRGFRLRPLGWRRRGDGLDRRGAGDLRDRAALSRRAARYRASCRAEAGAVRRHRRRGSPFRAATGAPAVVSASWGSARACSAAAMAAGCAPALLGWALRRAAAAGLDRRAEPGRRRRAGRVRDRSGADRADPRLGGRYRAFRAAARAGRPDRHGRAGLADAARQGRARCGRGDPPAARARHAGRTAARRADRPRQSRFA